MSEHDAQRAARRGAWTWILRLVGVGLIVLVVWLVGWDDRVVGTDGVERTGRVASWSDTQAELRDPSGGTRAVAINGPSAVRLGLASAWGTLLEHPGPAWAGVFWLALSMLLMQGRWAVFLNATGLRTRAVRLLRLGWLGMFFNQVLPAGQVGGDFVKAYAVTHAHPERKTQAVVSVLADRGIGLFALCLAAAAGLLFADSGTPVALARTVVYAFLGVCVGFLALVCSRRLRTALRVHGLIDRLPASDFWRRVGAAFVRYGKPSTLAWGTLVGLIVHASFLVAFWFLGRALEVELSAYALLVAIPVALMAGTIPGLPAGWGYGDLAFFFLLPAAGVPGGRAVALSFVFRAILMLISLPGAWFLSDARAAGPEEGSQSDNGR